MCPKGQVTAHSPHVVIFFEQSVVFNRPLLELHVYTAAVDADDAPDATGGGGEMDNYLPPEKDSLTGV